MLVEVLQAAQAVARTKAELRLLYYLAICAHTGAKQPGPAYCSSSSSSSLEVGQELLHVARASGFAHVGELRRHLRDRGHPALAAQVSRATRARISTARPPVIALIADVKAALGWVSGTIATMPNTQDVDDSPQARAGDSDPQKFDRLPPSTLSRRRSQRSSCTSTKWRRTSCAAISLPMCNRSSKMRPT